MTDAPADTHTVETVRASAVRGWNHEAQVMAALETDMAAAARRRDSHVRTLCDTGLSYREAAALLGITAARIGQIIARIRTRTTDSTPTSTRTEGTDGLQQHPAG